MVAALVGLAGAWLGMLLWSGDSTDLGPFRVRVEGSFGRGVTDIALPPFGRLTADTHLAPLHLTVTLQDVGATELAELLRQEGAEGLTRRVERDALRAIAPYALRLFGVAVAGAVGLSLLAFRTRWRAVGMATLASTLVVGGGLLAAWQTFRPGAFLSPSFSGSLSLASELVGPVGRVTNRIEDFRTELERVVASAARAYTRIQANPLGQGDEIRVLHISDVHLSPLGLDFAREVADAFEVDLVLDTGDLTSFGTPFEELIVGSVRRFDRPYVFVRGNHDSRSLELALGRVPNVVVLDGEATVVEGLTIYGRGHPLFTPGRQPISDEEFGERTRAATEAVALDLSRLPRDPDIVAVHDDRMVDGLAGEFPLVVSGHFHEPSARMVDGTLFLRIGSTGGSGFTVFSQPGGVPLSVEVLYFSRADPPVLVAFDVIEQSPATGSLSVERHLVAEEFGAGTPAP